MGVRHGHPVRLEFRFGENDAMSDESSIPFASIWTDLRGVSFEQGWLDADGIRTRFLMAGERTKPLLILLHGVGGHAEAYSRNLGAHARHFWTIAIDMVGHGWTDKPSLSYCVADYANHVLSVLKALGRDRMMVSGESLGGWVATWLAVHHPAVVDRLVLNTAGGWTGNPTVMARLKMLSNQAASDPTWSRIQERLAWLMYDKQRVADDLVETRQAIYAQPGYAQTMRRIMSLQDMEVRRPNMISETQYRSIRAPTLVVWTSHDPTATPEEGEQIARMIPDSRYVVMNQCGHWPQFENAAAFNLLHVDFLLGRSLPNVQGVQIVYPNDPGP
jgi:2-hydroxy-6-oxonona-2,4-dienedioate hydrolase